MGAPVELKTVLSSSRGTQRRYEVSEAHSEQLSRASLGAIALAAVALFKEFLFGSEPASAAEVENELSLNSVRAGAAFQSPNASTADDAKISASDTEPLVSASGVLVKAHFAADYSQVAEEADYGTQGVHSPRLTMAAAHLSVSNDQSPAEMGMSSVGISATHRSGSGGGSRRGGGKRDNHEENAAPVVRQPLVLHSSGFNQSLLITVADLLQGIVDADADELAVADLASSSGHVTHNNDGTWTYVPEANASGPVTFTYEVTDGYHVVAAHASLEFAPVQRAMEETITGASKGGTIVTYRAADQVEAGPADDHAYTGEGNERVNRGDGYNIIFGGAGDDVIGGSPGNDFILAGDGRDVVHGDDGADILTGGNGDDAIDGGSGNDRIVAGNSASANTSEATLELASGSALADGNDDYDGGEGADTLDLSAITSNTVVDLSAGTASGQDVGSDKLANIENVIGGSGDDTIVDSAVHNEFTGGGGQDTFAFTGLDAPGRLEQADKIRDFESGDKVDVSRVDADKGTGSYEALVFIGEVSADSHSMLALKQMGFKFEVKEDGEHTYLFAKTSQVTDEYDFAVDFFGHHQLTSDDFIGVA